MATNAISGVGTKFFRNGTAVAEVVSINGPGMTREFIDASSLDTEDGYRDFIAGFRDGGTVTFNANFTRAGYDMMKEDFEDDNKQVYEIVLPDADVTSIEFLGLVTELPLSIPTDDKVSMDITIKVCGQVTVNSGTGSEGA